LEITLDVKIRLINLKNEALQEVNQASNTKHLEDLRIKYLGRKSQLTDLINHIKELPEDIRPQVGKEANKLKNEIEALIKEKILTLPSKEEKLPKLDITLPPFPFTIGKSHPISQVLAEIINILQNLGFHIALGPEIELSYHNFDALNIPPDHPARDMHDTFYINNETILRTHTSPVQIRVMKKQTPPIRIIVPGKVYRKDADISHSPMFHQVEGLYVDTKVTFSDLKGILTILVRQIFGKETGLRFRPSFFPFTEPSAEIDISCQVCKGKGCRVCSYTGWLEILGAGMVDPEVFKMVDYSIHQYSGFAFGLGVERVAMLKYKIDDIRLLFENDLRFLSQF